MITADAQLPVLWDFDMGRQSFWQRGWVFDRQNQWHGRTLEYAPPEELKRAMLQPHRIVFELLQPCASARRSALPLPDLPLQPMVWMSNGL
jgi:hypothetical protein